LIAQAPDFLLLGLLQTATGGIDLLQGFWKSSALPLTTETWDAIVNLETSDGEAAKKNVAVLAYLAGGKMLEMLVENGLRYLDEVPLEL